MVQVRVVGGALAYSYFGVFGEYGGRDPQRSVPIDTYDQFDVFYKNISSNPGSTHRPTFSLFFRAFNFLKIDIRIYF